MKKIIASLLIIAFGSTGLMAQKTINDSNAEIREAKNFHGIDVSNAFDVYLSQSNEEAVAVSAVDQKTRDRIVVEVKNGILYIGLEKGTWKLNNGNKKLKAYISFKTIDKLAISGACDVFVDGVLKADELKIDLSGASDIKNVKLDVKKMNLDISGASDMKASGTVVQLTVEAQGASNFRGIDLATEFCNARASGASDISITVNKELSAQASGASGIKYKGDGVIRDIKTNGASRISKI
ncbi:MAG TPA: head GIN domain-containing protein [Chitinophagaceae bacterium]